jgi:hypothetical protein
MNQHITKLVRQALKECVSTPVESVIASRIDDHGIVEIPNTFAERFAELIVKECIAVCASGWQGEFTAAGISQCVSDLKEHFEVE